MPALAIEHNVPYDPAEVSDWCSHHSPDLLSLGTAGSVTTALSAVVAIVGYTLRALADLQLVCYVCMHGMLSCLMPGEVCWPVCRDGQPKRDVMCGLPHVWPFPSHGRLCHKAVKLYLSIPCSNSPRVALKCQVATSAKTRCPGACEVLLHQHACSLRWEASAELPALYIFAAYLNYHAQAASALGHWNLGKRAHLLPATYPRPASVTE